MLHNCSILSLVPYRLLPPVKGMQKGIVPIHEELGKLCQNHLISTMNNGPDELHSFQLHPVYPAGFLKYVPCYALNKIAGIGKRYDANFIYCEHPYLSFTAMALSRKLKIPWFLRSHYIISERLHELGRHWWGLARNYEQYVMQRADGIFFTSRECLSRAQQQFRLEATRCHFIPYGTECSGSPEPDDRLKERLAEEWGLDAGKPWLYFRGDFTAQYNTEAAHQIIHHITPLLPARERFEILIAGPALPEALQQDIRHTQGLLKYLDTTDDAFCRASDIILNPVTSKTGVVPHIVQGLGCSRMVVSCETGAAGLHRQSCGNNLHTVPDFEWEAFAAALHRLSHARETIPPQFYQTYSWSKVAGRIMSIMEQSRTGHSPAGPPNTY